MSQKTKILMLEDMPEDAELIQDELKKAKISFSSRLVETMPDLDKELKSFKPDIIFLDYTLPACTGMEALLYVKENFAEIPVIIITGSINEETAVECMKAGAADYVLKGNLIRLIPALLGALEKRKLAQLKIKTDIELRESDKRFRRIFENTVVGLYRITPDGKIILANPRLAEMLGYDTVDELYDRNLEETNFRQESSREKFIKQIETDGQVMGLESVWLKKDGSTVYLSESAKVFRNNKGRDIYYEGVVEDITEKKTALDEIKRQTVFLCTLIDTIPAPVFYKDCDGRFLGANPAFENFTGLKNDEIVGKTMFDSAQRNIAEKYWQKDKELLESPGTQQYEWKVINKEGRVRDVIFDKATFADAQGKLAGLIGIITDVTERKYAEEKMIMANERLQYLLFSTSAIVYAAKANTQYEITFISDNISQLTGHLVNTVLKDVKFWTAQIHPQDLQNVINALKLLNKMENINHEYRFRTKDGRYLWFHESVKLVKDADNKPLEYIGHLSDISSRKQAENSLKISEEKHRAYIANAPYGIFILDSKGRYLDVNAAASTMTGYSRQELLKMTIQDLSNPMALQDNLVTFSELQKKGKVKTEINICRKDDSEKYFSMDAVSLSRDLYMAFCSDITEKKLLEQQFQQAQKMEAVGRLAGGVAHDFNNLLTIINGYSTMLMEELDEADTLYKDAEQIHNAGQRAVNLTKQLLAFSRKQVIQPIVVNMNTIIVEVEKMARRLIGEDVGLVINLGPETGNVNIDPGQVEQIVFNLVVNARDAMPRGGKIFIETKNIEFDDDYLKKHPVNKPGRYVLMSVSDTGSGMDKKTQARIFEPFYTTKSQDKGTGLGLSTVYGIIKQNNGYIWVYSEPDKGTVFKIYLPRAMAEAVEVTPKKIPKSSLKGNETILIVEDDETVREFAAEILKDKGYTVIEAGDGRQALFTVDQFGGHIDLVLTDVIMPGMSGLELAERLSKTIHQLKIIYVSGYTDDTVVNHGIMHSEMEFIQKPFTAMDLLEKVRIVLDGN